MHAIFVAVGSRGDLYPVLGLGRCLRDAGHAVTVISTGNFGPAVRGAGLGFVEIMDGDTAARVARLTEEHWTRRVIVRRWTTEAVAIFREYRERMVDVVTQVSGADRAFLAVTIGLDLGAGAVAARKLGLPRVGIWIAAQLMSIVRPRMPLVLRPLSRALFNGALRITPDGRALRQHDAQLRSSLGLPPEPDMYRALYQADLSVGLFPSWYLPGHVRRPDTVFPGFALYEPDGDLPPALDAFLDAGPPPVVFTNASWRATLDDYYSNALGAAQELGLRVVCVGRHAPQLPPHDGAAMSVEYAPLKRLLPRSAAIVHHGGIGTVARAMAEGTPQLVVPWTLDQPFNAARVERLGVGLSVRSSELASQLAPRLEELLGSSRIRARCSALARRLDGGPDYRPVIRRLERMIDDHAAAGPGHVPPRGRSSGFAVPPD